MDMAVIQNKWVEKIKKKKMQETAPSYASDPTAESIAYNAKKPIKRHTNAARAVLVKTLRGVRK